MLSELNRIGKRLKNTILHPQWIANRYHLISRQSLGKLHSCKILDIGSGDSDHTTLLHSSNDIFCLDYPVTNQRYQNTPDIFGDACALPVGNETMDVVLLLEVLEHIGEDTQAIHSIKNVLKKGGRLYLSLPFLYPIHDAPYDFRRFTIHGIRHSLQKQGLKILNERSHGNSLVTAMQLMNLSLLEIIRDTGKKSQVIGFFMLLIFYPLCLLSNIVAWPLLYLRWNSSSCLGYFIIAERT